MNRQRMKQLMLNLFKKYSELQEESFVLWFVERFKHDINERGLQIERILTVEEKQKLQELQIESKTVYKRFSHIADIYYDHRSSSNSR